MHAQRSFFTTLSILLVALSTATFVFAGNAGYIFSFNKDPDNLFERSDVRMAVDQFCQMLSIDPKNRTVEENLDAIVNHPQLTASQRSHVFLLEDLLGHITDLQRRTEYWISKRNVLRDQLIGNGCPQDALFKGLSDIQNNISGSNELFSYPKQALFDRSSPLVIINDLLIQEKIRLSIRVRALQNQYDWLKMVSQSRPYFPSPYFAQSFEGPVFASFEANDGNGYPNADIRIIEPKKNDGMVLTSQEDEGRDPQEEKTFKIVSLPAMDVEEEKADQGKFVEFKKELGTLYVQLDKLEKRVTEEDEKSRNLQSQVVNLSLKLSETELQLDEKAQAVGSLTAQLADVEERLALGQRMIREKDDQMLSLQEDLHRLQLETESRAEKQGGMLASKDQRLVELESSLKNTRDDLAQSNKEVQEKARDLETVKKELAEVQSKVASGRKVIQAKEDEIVMLRAELANARFAAVSEPEERDSLLAQKDKELKELNGFLNIYRQGLGQADRVIEEKTRQLASMEAELKKWQNQLILKSGKYQQKDDQIRLLKEALLRERKQEEQHNVNLRKLVFQKDQEIENLREELGRAQKSLQVATRVMQEKESHLDYAKKELMALKHRDGVFPGENLTELSGILNIYKDKLSEESKAAREKAASISALEKQLTLMETELSDKNEALAKTQRVLRDMEDQLTVMKQELLKLQDRPEEKGSYQNDVDRQVQQGQSKFRDINDFLVENLPDSDRIKTHLVVP